MAPQYVTLFGLCISRAVLLIPHFRGLLDAYWTQETIDSLMTVDDIPELRSLRVPDGLYICARTNRMRENAAKVLKGPLPPSPREHYRDSSRLLAPPPHAYHQAVYTPPAPLPSSPSLRSSAVSATSSNASWSPPPVHSFPPPPPPRNHGIQLAPLDQLMRDSQRRRDPADESMLRSLNRRRW